VPGPLPEGPTAIKVTAIDPAGNISTPTVVNVTIDNTPPPPPVVISPQPGDGPDDTGTIVVTGTADPGTTIVVTVDGGTPVTTTTNPDGTYTVEVIVPPGAATITVVAVDAAGNQSQAVGIALGSNGSGRAGSTGGNNGLTFISGGVGRGCRCSADGAVDPSVMLAGLLFVARALKRRREA